MSMKRIPVILVALLMVCLPAASARADAAPPEDPLTVGISPDFAYLPTQVRMVSEDVTMVLGESTEIVALFASLYGLQPYAVLDITANFHMENMGDVDETMKVMFPLTGADTCSQDPYDFSYSIRPQSFWVMVDGSAVSYEEITTDSPSRSSFCDPVRWASFEVVFPVHTPVLISIGYRMMNNVPGTYYQEFGFRYILQTGAAWNGTIGQVDITFIAPNELTDENAWGTPATYEIDGNKLRWHWDDLEPTNADNVHIQGIGYRLWEKIVSLRNTVNGEPENASAWFELANKYYRFVWGGRHDRIESLYFANLAEEAYLKAVKYDPGNAEYHRVFSDYLLTRCMVQSYELNAEPSTALSYCASAVYEANYAWTLEPDNEELCVYNWIDQISDYDSPCPTSTSAYTPTRTPSGTPTVTPTRTNRPPSTPFPTWRPSGTLLPTAVPPQQDDTSVFPIFLSVFGGLIVITAVILFVRKRKSARRG